MRDNQHMHLPRSIIDTVDHSPVTNSKTQTPSEFSGETLDVVVPPWVALQLSETPRQFACERWIGRGEEGSRFGREDQLKHPVAPCAS